MEMDAEELTPVLKELILGERVSVVYGDRHPNPHIRALDDESIAEQIAKLMPEKLENACVYPLQKHLESVVNKRHFCHRPYTLKLALGAPQYSFDFFDPSILDHYLKLPHCSISNDLRGVITLPYGSVQFSKAVYASKAGHPLTELLATHLGQLALLPDFDQQFWHKMSIPVECTLHPDIVLPLVQGSFRQRLSVFEAIQEEVQAVNALCEALGKPRMFLQQSSTRNEFRQDGFLVSPTLKAFNEFFQQFQINWIQNINPAWLETAGYLPGTGYRKKRKTPLRRPSKTSLERIADWLSDEFDVPGPTPVNRLARLIKKTRRELHKRIAQENMLVLDPALHYLQRRLMWNLYQSIKWIRIHLECGAEHTYHDLHPLARQEKIWIR